MNVKGEYVVRILYLLFISAIITSCIAKRSLVPPVTKGNLENKSLSDLDPNDSINVEIDLEHEYEQAVDQ